MAENQNINEWNKFGNVIPTLMDRVSQFQTFQSEARAKKQIENIEASNRTKQDLYISWLNTEDHWVAKSCNRAIKLTQVADWIRDFYKDQVDFSDSYWTDSNVIKTYIDSNPSSWPYLKAYVTDDEDTTCDPTQLYRTMGWIAWEERREQNTGFYDLLYWKDESSPWPLRRWVSAVVGTIAGLWEWTWEAMKRVYNNVWDIKDIATDDDKSFMEKYNQILFWELLYDTVGWSVWDIIWWGLSWGWKWFTSQQERNTMSDAVAWFVRTLLETETWEDAINWWNSLSDEEKKEAEDYLTYIDWAINLAWLKFGKAAWPAVERWVTKTISAARDWIWPIAWSVDKAIDATKIAIKNKSIKNAVKNEAKNSALVEEIADRVWQWATKDIWSSVRALQSISKWTKLKKVNTFKELREKGLERVKQLVNKVDENLSNYKNKKITLADQNVTTINWEETGKVIEDAFNDLIDVYTKQRRPEDVKRILDLRDEVTRDWIGYKEFNDFIREYWRELNAWNKKNELTTDAKKWWENTRNWMKDILHEKVPDEEFKNLDSEMSDVINFNKLVETSIEKTNNLVKRLRKEGFWDKTVWKAVEWWLELLDILAWRWFSRAIKWMVWWKSAWKVVDYLELENELPKLLKAFEKLDSQLTISKNAKSDTAIKDAANELSTLVNEIKNP